MHYGVQSGKRLKNLWYSNFSGRKISAEGKYKRYYHIDTRTIYSNKNIDILKEIFILF